MSDWELSRTYGSSAGEVRWERLGDPAAPPVVLCHGTPFSSYVWRRIARELARDHQVYVWDMPGYGVSAQFEGQDVSLGAQGRVFAELLAHWGLGAPAVVAHDFGGAVALRAHLLHGAAYRRLALVDPVALAPWGSAFFRLVGEHHAVFEQLPPAPRAGPRVRLLGQQPRARPGRPRPARPALGGGGGAARLLPADRPGRPAVHRRDPRPVRLDRAAGDRLLGRGRRVDSGGEGARTGLGRARRRAGADPRGRTPGAGGCARPARHRAGPLPRRGGAGRPLTAYRR
ncbi:alpha/beta fold hydrolase [Streptomyces albidoflavus]